MLTSLQKCFSSIYPYFFSNSTEQNEKKSELFIDDWVLQYIFNCINEESLLDHTRLVNRQWKKVTDSLLDFLFKKEFHSNLLAEIVTPQQPLTMPAFLFNRKIEQKLLAKWQASISKSLSKMRLRFVTVPLTGKSLSLALPSNRFIIAGNDYSCLLSFYWKYDSNANVLQLNLKQKSVLDHLTKNILGLDYSDRHIIISTAKQGYYGFSFIDPNNFALIDHITLESCSPFFYAEKDSFWIRKQEGQVRRYGIKSNGCIDRNFKEFTLPFASQLKGDEDSCFMFLTKSHFVWLEQNSALKAYPLAALEEKKLQQDLCIDRSVFNMIPLKEGFCLYQKNDSAMVTIRNHQLDLLFEVEIGQGVHVTHAAQKGNLFAFATHEHMIYLYHYEIRSLKALPTLLNKLDYNHPIKSLALTDATILLIANSDGEYFCVSPVTPKLIQA